LIKSGQLGKAGRKNSSIVKWDSGQFSDETNRANSGSFPTEQKTETSKNQGGAGSRNVSSFQGPGA